jgi:hypothetical protein
VLADYRIIFSIADSLKWIPLNLCFLHKLFAYQQLPLLVNTGTVLSLHINRFGFPRKIIQIFIIHSFQSILFFHISIFIFISFLSENILINSMINHILFEMLIIIHIDPRKMHFLAHSYILDFFSKPLPTKIL